MNEGATLIIIIIVVTLQNTLNNPRTSDVPSVASTKQKSGFELELIIVRCTSRKICKQSFYVMVSEIRKWNLSGIPVVGCCQMLISV